MTVFCVFTGHCAISGEKPTKGSISFLLLFSLKKYLEEHYLLTMESLVDMINNNMTYTTKL